MKLTNLIASAALLFLLPNCSMVSRDTQTAAYKSESLDPSTRYHGVVVWVETPNLLAREALERKLVAALDAKGISAVPALQFQSPVDPFDLATFRRKALGANKDTLLQITLAGERHEFVSTGSTTNCYGSGSFSGSKTNLGGGYSSVSGTTNASSSCHSFDDGYTVHEDTIETNMTDLNTGRKVWMSRTESHGKGWFGGDVETRAINDLVRELEFANLFDVPLPTASAPEVKITPGAYDYRCAPSCK
jgi:hypothetical protein